jgi:cytochrome c551
VRIKKAVGSEQWAVGKKWKPNHSRLSYCLLLTTYCLLLSSCTSDPKYQQYYNQGEQLYIKHCSNCHQKDGKGLGLVYPPLENSDYLNNNLDDVICLMRYGISGELIVNGQSYNKPMPGIPTLTDLEIAEIATYIYNTWHPHRGIIEVRAVADVSGKCKP